MVSFVEKKIKSVRVYKGTSISFYKDTVLLPDGRESTRDYISHPGAVSVIPFLNKNDVLMVRQYRYPVKKTILEIPAGKMNHGEAPLSCAKRELVEETGYWPGRIKPLLSFWPTPAFATELMYIFVAWDLKSKKVQKDPDEFLEPVVVKLKTLGQWVRSGKIQDAKSVIAILAINALSLNPYAKNQ